MELTEAEQILLRDIIPKEKFGLPVAEIGIKKKKEDKKTGKTKTQLKNFIKKDENEEEILPDEKAIESVFFLFII